MLKIIKDKHLFYEYIEKKSKFLVNILYLTNQNSAKQFIENISCKHKDASHNVYAYKIIENSNEIIKFSDDNEPQNTAGKPIIELIKILDIVNIVVVVTRYFGGVKLGASNLSRAYAKSVNLCLKKTDFLNYELIHEILIEFDYKREKDIEKILKEIDVKIYEKIFLNKVVFRISISEKNIAKLKKFNFIKIRDQFGENQ